jgi:hypothetical protein
MNKLRDYITLAVFLILVLLAWAGLASLPKPNIVSFKGVYDLRSFDFANSILAFDTGNVWETWSDKFYTPQDFANGETGTASLHPDWRREQYFTHRVSFLLAPGGTFGLSMKSAD